MLAETLKLDALTHAEARAMPAWQRWWKGLSALRQVMKDPNRTDYVLTAGQYLNAGSERGRIDRFHADPDGARIYREDRSLDGASVDAEALLALPEGTLGHAYARFMRDRGLTPDIFDAPKGLDRATFVIKRLRQSHDLWHVLTGIDTDISGELELQAFTYAQIRAPLSLVLVVMGTLRWSWRHPEIFGRVLRGFRRGKAARWLAVVPWEDHWTTALSELRAALRV